MREKGNHSFSFFLIALALEERLAPAPRQEAKQMRIWFNSLHDAPTGAFERAERDDNAFARYTSPIPRLFFDSKLDSTFRVG